MEGCGRQTAEKLVILSGKQKPRRLREQAGFKKATDDESRILNYLHASMGSLPKTSRLGIASGLHPFVERSMPRNISTPDDHRVVCGCLGYAVVEVICAEGFEEIWSLYESVNHINEKIREGRLTGCRSPFSRTEC